MIYDFYYVKELYTPEMCEELRTLILLHYNRDDSVKDVPADGATKTADVKFINRKFISPELEKFYESIGVINSLAFRFHLDAIGNESILSYNTYDSKTNGEYDWHTDGRRDGIKDIKLTALLNLSDEPYEGGDISLFFNGPHVIEEFRLPGTLLVFPSWVPHKVDPVTKGTRKTLIQFFEGPPLL